MKRANWRPIALVLVCFWALGCLHHRYSSGGYIEPVPRVDRWNHTFIYGLVSTSGQVQTDLVCPNGVAQIENYVSPIGFVLTLVTVGIYIPTTVKVWCVPEQKPGDGAPDPGTSWDQPPGG